MFHVKHFTIYFIFIIFSEKVTYISIFNTCRIHIDYDLHILCTIIYYTPFLEKVYLPPIYFLFFPKLSIHLYININNIREPISTIPALLNSLFLYSVFGNTELIVEP